MEGLRCDLQTVEEVEAAVVEAGWI